MKKLLLLSLISLQLLAQNPKLFSSLGDTMYNSLEKIKQLEDISDFQENYTFIEMYTKKTEALWAEGMMINDTSDSALKKKYLTALRQLAKDYDNLMRSVRIRLDKSITENDTKAFAQIINTGLLEVGESTPNIIDFYKKNVQASTKVPRIEAYLDSIKPAPRPIIVAGPTKLDRIKAREEAERKARIAREEAAEAAKKKKLKAEQLSQSR